MFESIIDRHGLAAELTLCDLLDDSYLAVPVQGAPGRETPQAFPNEAETARPTQVRPALRHLLD
ncbi:MAG: hypothetical protein ACFCUQ_22270 [Kiloniellales bacterium]